MWAPENLDFSVVITYGSEEECSEEECELHFPKCDLAHARSVLRQGSPKPPIPSSASAIAFASTSARAVRRTVRTALKRCQDHVFTVQFFAAILGNGLVDVWCRTSTIDVDYE